VGARRLGDRWWPQARFTCFARSSPRLHRGLLANRLFGPLIRDWQEHRSIAPQAKRAAIATIVVVGAVTVGFVISHALLRVTVVVTMAAVIVWLSRLPARPAPGPAQPE
jgi:hypothetical protein